MPSSQADLQAGAGEFTHRATQIPEEKVRARAGPSGSMPITGSRHRSWFILILCLFAAAAAGAVYAMYHTQAADARSRGYATLEAVSELKVDSITRWLGNIRISGEALSADPILNDQLPRLFSEGAKGSTAGPAAAVLQTWISNQLPEFDALDGCIFDLQGRLLAATGKLVDPDSILRDSVREAADTSGVVLSDLHLHFHGNAALSVAIPLIASGRALGVLGLHVDPEVTLFPLIQSWPGPSPSSESLLVERRGDSVVYLNELRHRHGTALKLSLPLAKRETPAVMAVEGLRGAVEGVDYRGNRVIAHITDVPGTPWFLVVKTDVPEIIGPVRTRTIWFGFGLFAIIGLAGTAAGLQVSRRQREGSLRLALAERDRQLAERALDLTAARLRAVFEADVMGALVADLDGTITEANDAFLRMIGRSRDDILRGSVSWRELTPKKFASTDDAKIEEARLQGASAPYEKQIICADGRRVWVLAGLVLLPEETERFAALVIDISTQKKAEHERALLTAQLEERVRRRTAQLEAANKELESFSYSVSHDLRAPLRAMDGFSAALQEDYGERLDEQAKDFLTRIRQAAQRMAELIDDLLGLSRVTIQQLRYERVDLAQLAEAIAQDLTACDGDREVRWKIAGPLKAHGDPLLLRLLLENLLGNAWKFTSRHQEAIIDLRAEVIDGERTFVIRDDGAGFDMAYCDKLFTPFQRLHGAAEFPGTGIGLAIAGRIVARHGGRIWAEAAPEQGAAFYFTLPAEGAKQ